MKLFSKGTLVLALSALPVLSFAQSTPPAIDANAAQLLDNIDVDAVVAILLAIGLLMIGLEAAKGAIMKVMNFVRTIFGGR